MIARTSAARPDWPFAKTARSEEDLLTWAMNTWRSSFGNSRIIRELAEGGHPSYPSGKYDPPMEEFAKLLLKKIPESGVQRYGYRVHHGDAPEPGEVMEFALAAAAKSARDVQGYESFSDVLGASAPRGVWFQLLNFPALVYPDGKEFILSGRFRVTKVEPFTPEWESRQEPGRDTLLDGKRVLVTAEYVGPISSHLAAKYAGAVEKVQVLSLDPDPETKRFQVFVDGYLEMWTLDRIKRAIAEGAQVTGPGKFAAPTQRKLTLD